MRKLNTSDIFAAFRVVKAAGIREELKPVLRKISEGNTNLQDIGIEVILTLMEAAGGTKTEEAVNAFFAAPLEMTKDEFSNLGLEELIEKLKELAKENDLASFFNALSDLMNMKSLT